LLAIAMNVYKKSEKEKEKEGEGGGKVTTRHNCAEMLDAKFAEGKNVCVGLDTDPQEISKEIDEFLRDKYKIPPSASQGVVMREFNKEIVRATCDLAGAYKYNYWFYANQLYQGLHALECSIAFSKKFASDVPIILDFKVGDVGLSMKKAAEFAFDNLGVDAATVNPWGGYEDGLDAFFGYKDKMIFVWCRSSNKGARDFQDLDILGWTGDQERGRLKISFLYAEIAKRAAQLWNVNGNCGLVIGATFPEELKQIRKLVGDEMPILVPGIGAQGGDLVAAVKVAMPTGRQAGPRTLFSASRSIIYASKGLDFAEAARAKAEEMHEEIRKTFQKGGL